MKTKKSIYVCQTCGYESLGWLGKCAECGTWGSMVETAVSTSSKQSAVKGRQKGVSTVKPVTISSIKTSGSKRTLTKISELDRVLGGGIVSGQVSLIAGEPGIGKSTILLQLADKLGDVLYVSGEESAHQIALRAERLAIRNKEIRLIEETNIDEVVSVMEGLASGKTSPKAIIVDSIQTMFTGDLRGMSGSPGQVRECAYRLVRSAKRTNTPLFIVGHVTKEGSVAGPALLMHIVDTVLWFEGSKDLSFRILRARKNRFGPTDEVGIFTMDSKGLSSVDETHSIFLSGESSSISGSCVTSIMEGTRPILVEIQSLIVPTKLAFPKRVAQGIDSKRLELLLAVLQRRAGLPMYDFDCYVNVVGGIRVKETGVDLAICMAIASSYYDKALPNKFVAIGEVGLLGEVRKVVSQERRISEARRLGFTKFVTDKDAKYVREAVNNYFKKK